jgi:hypothetical protein
VRNRLSKKILEDLLSDWQEHGVGAIKVLRITDPVNYVRICVSTLPRELTVETAMADVDDEELDVLIEAMRQRVLEARQQMPVLIEDKVTEHDKQR